MLDDGRTDRSAGTHYNQYDRVRIEKSWKDLLRKESDHRAETGGMKANFQMNLANQSGTSGLLRLVHSHNRLEYVTEKEHKQSPKARMSIKGKDPKSFEIMAIKHLEKKPGHKWDLPEATSHDIGWMSGDFVRSHTMMLAPNGNALSANGQAAVGNRQLTGGGHTEAPLGASRSPTRDPPPGSLAHASLGLPMSAARQTIVTVANDHILRRVQSAPHLPHGPHPPEVKELNNLKWRRPMNTTDVTEYAEIYHSLLHHSPFNQAAAGR